MKLQFPLRHADFVMTEGKQTLWHLESEPLWQHGDRAVRPAPGSSPPRGPMPLLLPLNAARALQPNYKLQRIPGSEVGSCFSHPCLVSQDSSSEHLWVSCIPQGRGWTKWRHGQAGLFGTDCLKRRQNQIFRLVPGWGSKAYQTVRRSHDGGRGGRWC